MVYNYLRIVYKYEGLLPASIAMNHAEILFLGALHAILDVL